MKIIIRKKDVEVSIGLEELRKIRDFEVVPGDDTGIPAYLSDRTVELYDEILEQIEAHEAAQREFLDS
jgi:hypothetical protein